MSEFDEKLAGEVAAASAECGMQTLARFLPVEFYTELRETLHDMCFSAMLAYAEVDVWRRPPDFSLN